MNCPRTEESVPPFRKLSSEDIFTLYVQQPLETEMRSSVNKCNKTLKLRSDIQISNLKLFFSIYDSWETRGVSTGLWDKEGNTECLEFACSNFEGILKISFVHKNKERNISVTKRGHITSNRTVGWRGGLTSCDIIALIKKNL